MTKLAERLNLASFGYDLFWQSSYKQILVKLKYTEDFPRYATDVTGV